MKKCFVIFSFLLSNLGLFATTTPSVIEEKVTLKCTFENCSSVDSVSLYRTDGYFRQLVATAHLDASGSFVFKMPKTKMPQFYFLGLNTDSEKIKGILLGTENEVNVTGPCYNMVLTSVTGSKVNADYDDAEKKVNNLKIEMNKVVQSYQQNYSNETMRKDLENQMLEVDKKKMRLLDSLKKTNPFVSKIAALDTYTSFQHSPKKATFKDEIEYFATQYFQYVDLKDSTYNNIPYLFDMFRNYTQVILLPDLRLSKEQQKKYFDNYLKQFPAKSKAYKFALSGMITIMTERTNILLLEYGEQYLADFPDELAERKNVLSMSMNQMKSQMLGVPAPEIAQADTTGMIRKLSSMKGKVVLIDFWASWCGPCRRENPNVVKLYNKYKSKGFEVFSVSLDQDRERWVKAINDDGLLWSNHVSDLKFWQNEAARTYSVQSIPRTILVDKNGLVVSRDLRGEGLEAKLKEIFGE